MTKSLNSQQLHAVELLASGLSEVEVAAQIKRSKSWLQRCKKDENFAAAVEAAKARNEAVLKEALAESQKKITEEQVAAWAARREEIRALEWDIASKLFVRSGEILDLPLETTKWSLADAHHMADAASKIGRKCCELWDKDLNAAIALVRNHGFDVVDAQEITLADTAEESDWSASEN